MHEVIRIILYVILALIILFFLALNSQKPRARELLKNINLILCVLVFVASVASIAFILYRGRWSLGFFVLPIAIFSFATLYKTYIDG
jgi:hypothetical protein